MSHPKTQRLDDDQADILIRILDEDGFAGEHPFTVSLEIAHRRHEPDR